MTYYRSRRYRGPDPALLRQLQGKPPGSILDQPATPFEHAFMAWAVATMFTVSIMVTLT